MIALLRAFLLVSLLAASAVEAHAQGWRGFVSGGLGSIDYGPDHLDSIGQVSVGVLRDLGTERVSVGGQVDVLLSGSYASARGGVLGEVAPVASARVRPFGNGGYFAGEGGSLWIAGGGLDVMFGRFGIRVFAQDAIRVSRVVGAFGSMSRTIHEPALQVGLAWR